MEDSGRLAGLDRFSRWRDGYAAAPRPPMEAKVEGVKVIQSDYDDQLEEGWNYLSILLSGFWNLKQVLVRYDRDIIQAYPARPASHCLDAAFIMLRHTGGVFPYEQVIKTGEINFLQSMCWSGDIYLEGDYEVRVGAYVSVDNAAPVGLAGGCTLVFNLMAEKLHQGRGF